MTFISCLLIGIGIADLIRARSRHRLATITATVVGVAAVIALHLLTTATVDGPQIAVIAGSALAVVLWIATTAHPSMLPRKAAVIALGATVVLGLALVPAQAAPALAQQWYAALPYPVIDTVPFARALAILALALFLIETANIVVRTVLELPDDEDAPRTTRGRLGARRPAPAPLKGGRLIGPLERIFMFALAMAGQFTAIGAIVAAKGIVRFPELSKDTRRGANAELFLVGSFTSWALVLGAVLFATLSG